MKGMTMNRNPLAFLVTFILLCALLLGACVAPPASGPQAPAAGESAESETAAEAPAVEGDKLVIKLAENPWSASSLNVNVAKILLEEQLGYTVELVTIGES